MTKTKTCAHCNYYSFELRGCKLRDIPVCNVATCSCWIPRVDLVMIKNIVFTDYEQYKLMEN